MNDNTELMKWAAWAAANRDSEVGRMLTKQADEIARLRSVCRDAAVPIERHIAQVLDLPNDRKLALRIAADLTEAGKEATDGQ